MNLLFFLSLVKHKFYVSGYKFYYGKDLPDMTGPASLDICIEFYDCFPIFHVCHDG